MEGFPSGQREQTVNLSSMTSVVRIHHLPPKQKDIPKGMSFFCFGGRWLWIRKVALRNVPVARFNHRGFRRNGSESTTGRVGTRVAVRLWDCISQSRQARARSEGKNRLSDSEINLHRLFGTIYCRLRCYLVGAHSMRQGSAKSYGMWANNVRPYGSAGADEFTNGVPRSYLRAPSLADLPQFTVAHPTEKIVHTEKYSRS